MKKFKDYNQYDLMFSLYLFFIFTFSLISFTFIFVGGESVSNEEIYTFSTICSVGEEVYFEDHVFRDHNLYIQYLESYSKSCEVLQ